MGFRINRGIFQYKDGENFRNKFKIAEDGSMVEVDVDGNPTTAYMKIGDKATDSDLLDGVTSASFLRSDAADTMSASLVMGTQQAIKASNYGHGVYGRYDSRKYQHVWGMGSSWHMDAGGSNLGNFYGLAYTHTNIGGESKSGLSHQTLFVENGLTKTAIGRGVWTDGNITATGNANISGNLDIGGAVVGTSSGVALAVGGTSTYGVHTGDNARNQLVVSANYYPHFVIAADLNNNPNHGAVISMVGTEGSSPRQWNIGISNQNPFLFSIGYNRSGDNNPHYGVGDNWSNDDNNHARLSIDRDGNTKIRGSLYVNGTKGGITTGSKVATESWSRSAFGNIYSNDWAGAEIRSPHGYISFGPANTSHAHIYTDRPNFYINKHILENGQRLATQSYARTVAGDVESTLTPQIATAQTTADNAATAASNAQSTADDALAEGLKAIQVAAAAQETADGKLGATAKAADSNLLDGIDSSRIVYGDGANGRSISRKNANTSDSSNASGFYFGNAVTGMPTSDWWNWLTVRGNSWSGNDGYQFQLAGSFWSDDYRIRRMTSGTNHSWVSLIHSGNIGSQTVANAGYATTAGSADQIDGWGFVNTGANSAVNADTITSNGISYYTGGVSNFSGNSTDGALYSQIYNSSWQHQIAGDYRSGQIALRGRNNGTWQAWRKVWDSGNFDPASKLGATAKAADSDKLDGYDWMQSGKNVRGSEFYVDGWFRNYNSGTGLYNQATTQHWYSDGDDYWNIAGGGSFNAIRFRDEHAGTQRGLVGADNSNRIGFLDAGGAWAVRHDNDSGTLFFTDGETLEFRVGRDKVTGSYGTVQTDTTRSGWGGYSIAGRYVFMSDHGSTAGIYNDVDNEWMAIFRRNSSVDLYYNNSLKFVTTSTGAAVTGTMTATSFAGDGAGLTNVSAPIPFTTVTGEATACVSMNFDGRAMVFTMADGTSYSIDGARPNQ